MSKNLKFLSRYGVLAHTQPTKDFESLVGVDNIYSMHIQGKTFNVRILYSFLDNGTILLYGFKEESGKRINDYSSAIQIAKKRYNELINSMEDFK